MPPTVAVEDEEEEAPRRWPLASSSSEASLAPHPAVRTGEEDEEATSQTPEVSYYYVAGSLAFFSPFPWHPLSDGLSVAGCRIGVVLRGGASAAI